MPSIWASSLARTLEHSLDQLTTAVNSCTAEQWETPMWAVEALPPGHQFLSPDWQPITESARVQVLAQRWVDRRSTPWSVAWHALETLDYDLNGDFAPWAPPPPFQGHPHWRDLPSLPRAWSQQEIVGYIEHCKALARDGLATMTDAAASRPLPATHRYGGQPHANIIAAIPGHTTEHAAQIRQFTS